MGCVDSMRRACRSCSNADVSAQGPVVLCLYVLADLEKGEADRNVAHERHRRPVRAPRPAVILGVLVGLLALVEVGSASAILRAVRRKNHAQALLLQP